MKEKTHFLQFNYIKTLFILPSLFLSFWLFNFYQVRSESLRQEAIAARETKVKDIAERLEKHLISAQQLTRSTASLVAPLRGDRQVVETTLLRLLESAPSETIYGIGVWFEPYRFLPSERYFGLYIHHNEEGELTVTYEWTNSEYDFHSQHWYFLGKEAGGEIVFTEPYFDTNLIYMTSIIAFFDNNNQFLGTVSVDIMLPLVRRLISEVNTNKNETIYITTEQGNLFVHPQEQELLDFFKNRDSKIKTILDLNEDDLQEFKEGTRQSPFHIISVIVEDVDWKIYIETDRDYLFANINRLQERTLLSLFFIWVLTGGLFWIWNREISQNIRVRKFENYSRILEEKVRDRTKELEAAKIAADAANLAKSEFIANISHELRTPLNGILGYTQLMQKSSDPEQYRSGVATIQQCGNHLLTLIEDILDISKIEARRIELFSADFHLISFLTEIIDMIRIHADQKKIKLKYNFDPNLPIAIYGDNKRLRQVLLNLLGNAVKFTETGSVTLTVLKQPNPNPPPNSQPQTHSQERENRRRNKKGRLTNNQQRCDPTSVQDASGQTPRRRKSQGNADQERERAPRQPTTNILFQIEDTGVGMSAEQIEKIFLPFEQVGRTERYYEGTGLGLAIAQQIITIMGSKIQVKSTLGGGSCFWFSLEVPIATEWKIPDASRSPEKIEVANDDRTKEFEQAIEMFPPSDRIAMLLNAARIGDIEEIESQAEALKKIDSQYLDFCDRLLDLAGNFDEEGILALLERGRNGDRAI
ncbi:MAG: ATP-binding protein [Cyanobacteria bacterium P01_E01_bin.42]